MYLGLLVCVSLLTIVLQIQPLSAGICNGGITELVSTTEKQIVRSPNFPGGYFNNELCRWNIEVQNSEIEVVRFYIQNSHIRNSATCGDDYVEVKDGGGDSRLIRKWCGELDDRTPATSSTSSISITFKTDGAYTDKGFEIVYWSVPKGLLRYKDVELTMVNFILFGIFIAIVLSISLGMGVIVIKRKQIGKKEALIEEERMAQMFSVRVEANGNITNGKPKSANQHDADKVTKRTSANNGEAKGGNTNKTQVICLEPALTEEEKNVSSTTTV